MKKLLLTATLTFLTVFASAEEANDESMAAAEKLLVTMKVQEDLTTNFKTSMEFMLQPMVQELRLSAEQTKKLNEIITDWWENDIDQKDIFKQYKVIYANNYTAEELAELELFYQTPLGAKVLALTPELTQRGMEIGMAAAQEKQPILMEKMQAFEASLTPEKNDKAPPAEATEEKPAANGE